MPRGKKSNRKRAGRGRRNRDVPDKASMSVKVSLNDGGHQFATGTTYSLMNTQLINLGARATGAAEIYQHYRIKKIAVTFKPTFDSFVAAAGGVSKPHLYHMIDKSGSIPTNITLEGMKQMGAKPKDLDEQPYTVSWRPSVLEAVMYAAGPAPQGVSGSKYKISPWLSTAADSVSPGLFNPSGIDHLGLYWFLECITNPIGMQYQVELEVQLEFKKPLITNYTGLNAARPALIAVKNSSPDGVVGGEDDNLIH